MISGAIYFTAAKKAGAAHMTTEAIGRIVSGAHSEASIETDWQKKKIGKRRKRSH